MVNLEKSLESLKREHGVQLIYDSTEDLLYRVVEGQRKPIRFEYDNFDNGVKMNVMNYDFENRLKPADLAMRFLAIAQVEEGIVSNLNEQARKQYQSGEHTPMNAGVFYMVWGSMKQVLKQKYNIDWLSPQEENPNLIFG